MQTFRVVDVDNLLFSYDRQAVVKHISDTKNKTTFVAIRRRRRLSNPMSRHS